MVWYCWPEVPWEPNMKEHDIKSVAELRSTTITINDDFYLSINMKRNCLKCTNNCLVKIFTWIALNTNNQWSTSNSSVGVLNENCKYYNKVNMCLARYSSCATTTNQPTSMAPNETGRPIRAHESIFWAKFGLFWAKNPDFY